MQKVAKCGHKGDKWQKRVRRGKKQESEIKVPIRTKQDGRTVGEMGVKGQNTESIMAPAWLNSGNNELKDEKNGKSDSKT